MNISGTKRSSLFRQLKSAATRFGKKTGYIVRQRTVTGFSFFLMLTFGNLGKQHPSLAGMAAFFDTRITRQAVGNRFSERSVDFMSAMLEFLLSLALSAKMKINASILEAFSRVQIFDSTGFELHRKLENTFPGTGGSASPAACKIHLGYDPRAAQIVAFELTRGTSSDSEWFKHHLHRPGAIKQNELLLFDQGFFSIENLLSIIQRKAYFLTRFFFSVSIFDAFSKRRINLHTELSNCSESQREFNVLLGPARSLQCRLVCLRATAAQAEKRRAKYKAIQQKRGKIFSQATFFFCGWTLLLTNIPTESIPVDLLYSVYRLRWQIELFFRSLKSVFKINSVSRIQNEFRVKSEILGKLSAALLSRYMLEIVRKLEDPPAEISVEKFFRFVAERTFYWGQLLLDISRSILRFIKKDLQRIVQRSTKITQNSRSTSLEVLYAIS